VRHQFGDDYALMDAPLLPAERSLDAVTDGVLARVIKLCAMA